MLDKNTIETVRAGFALVRPVAREAAAEFYRRLFVHDPSLKPMFRGDATEQGEKLMGMIATTEARLEASIQRDLREQTRFFFVAWSVILAFVVGLYVR